MRAGLSVFGAVGSRLFVRQSVFGVSFFHATSFRTVASSSFFAIDIYIYRYATHCRKANKIRVILCYPYRRSTPRLLYTYRRQVIDIVYVSVPRNVCSLCVVVAVPSN